MPISSQKEFKPINISVLTISDTRTEANDTSGQFLAKHVREKGHGLSHKQIVKIEIFIGINFFKLFIGIE